MEFTCRRCSAKFRAPIDGPVAGPVRLSCPACGHEMVLRPRFGHLQRSAVVADEDRPFRAFLAEQLQAMGFDVSIADNGESALERIRATAPQLVIINVYLKGKLGVEVAEHIKSDPALAPAKVVLIGALFRANRFRANPTNLYGADEYIEEQIPEKEFRQIIHRLFPAAATDVRFEEREREEARRLARLILSDIIIYHPKKVEEGIRNNSFFDVLRAEIDEGRQYYESRVPLRVRRDSEIYTETLQQFVDMKRDELTQA